ncbi:Short-chain dehydrogenase/reductase phmF [Cladobotryum mycophilum]|uniref:Short-chain dehydrogenase/reductase phmF n=1 Tax=Cladobotryum mycophilum TaxID=491253 RepID=A0ABR0SG24_9HYPO
MSTLCGLARNRFSAPSLESLQGIPLSGKTVIVTGASGGLGLEAARHYARLGASRVILAVRSQTRGDQAKNNILESLTPEQAKSCAVEVWIVDLASFASVKAFGDKVNNELQTLDIAILNAAVSKGEYSQTIDGWEETLQVNVLSTALLALLILPKMRQSSGPDWKPRMSIVGSRAHQTVSDKAPWQTEPRILQTLNDKDEFGKFADRYALSKLLVSYTSREIAKMGESPDGQIEVVVNYLCPGACKSDLARDWSSPQGKIMLSMIQATICKTTEEGSRTLVYASSLGEKSHGLWVHNDRIEEPGKLVINDKGKKLQAKIWDETLKVLEPYGV